MKKKTKTNMKTTIKIKYHSDIPELKLLPQGDWIDLYSANEHYLISGEYKPLSLGVSMLLPVGYEAHVVPRSSTFSRHGIILANGVGIIDESYCGNDDIWYFLAIALRDTTIPKHARICQFRLFSKMQKPNFKSVSALSDIGRGGLGSTGV